MAQPRGNGSGALARGAAPDLLPHFARGARERGNRSLQTIPATSAQTWMRNTSRSSLALCRENSNSPFLCSRTVGRRDWRPGNPPECQEGARLVEASGVCFCVCDCCCHWHCGCGCGYYWLRSSSGIGSGSSDGGGGSCGAFLAAGRERCRNLRTPDSGERGAYLRGAIVTVESGRVCWNICRWNRMRSAGWDGVALHLSRSQVVLRVTDPWTGAIICC